MTGLYPFAPEAVGIVTLVSGRVRATSAGFGGIKARLCLVRREAENLVTFAEDDGRAKPAGDVDGILGRKSTRGIGEAGPVQILGNRLDHEDVLGAAAERILSNSV